MDRNSKEKFNTPCRPEFQMNLDATVWHAHTQSNECTNWEYKYQQGKRRIIIIECIQSTIVRDVVTYEERVQVLHDKPIMGYLLNNIKEALVEIIILTAWRVLQKLHEHASSIQLHNKVKGYPPLSSNMWNQLNFYTEAHLFRLQPESNYFSQLLVFCFASLGAGSIMFLVTTRLP